MKYCILLLAFFTINMSFGQNIIPGQQVAQKLIIKSDTIRYWLYTPVDYQGKKSSYPLIIFLHGAGERGTNLELVKKHGPPKLVEEKKDFPFVLISPQCPEGQFWDTHLIYNLIKKERKRLNIDPSRIYLTGLSMGGFGTWAIASKYPKYFAATIPICGGGNPDTACEMKDIPTWVFHGARDEVVLPSRSEDMVTALKSCGGDVKLTIYPEAGHDSWTETYNNPEIYNWLLNKTKIK